MTNALEHLALDCTGLAGPTTLPAILVVEDDARIRGLLGSALEGDGYPTTLVGDAATARDLLAAHAFALVVCDLNLPGESGTSLVAYIAAEHPETGVVVVSGGSDRATADHVLALGA